MQTAETRVIWSHNQYPVIFLHHDKQQEFLPAPEPWSLVAEGYVTDTQPLFRQYCERALALSGFNGGKVLDVACGHGTLSLLIADQAKEIHTIDFSGENPIRTGVFERYIFSIRR
jgi:2-polyprenyl-3-methyl-5-hydroxy-6-metoxy-1,4-benzoquinol methylase